MKRAILLSLVLSLTTSIVSTVSAQSRQLQAHTSFGFRGDGSILPGDYYWLTSTGGTGTGDNLNRGMAYNPHNNHLYIPYRTNSTSVPEGIHILDGSTGLEITPSLDLSGVTNRGTITMMKIGVAEDGVIYAMNFGSWSGTTNTIYRWSDETAPSTIAFAGNPAPTTSSQWGYTFDVRGGGTNTQILITTSSTSSGNGQVASLLTTTDGTNFTARQLTTDAAPGSIGLNGAAAFGPGNTFWAKSLNNSLQYLSFDTNAGTATVLRQYDLSEFPASIGPFGVQIQSNLLAGVDVSTPDSVILFSFTNTTGEMTFLSRTNTPTDNLNRFSMGSVIFYSNLVYVLDCNNGVWALDVISAPPPPQVPYVSGPVLQYGSVGTNLTLSAFAIGSAPLSLQWQVSHSISNTAFADIPNATNAVLVLTNLQGSDEGLYHLVVSNELAVVTSVDAQVLAFPDNTGILTPLWSLAPGSRPYVTPDASSTPFQRSIAYNALSNQVILISRTNATTLAGLSINVIDATTGADLYRLKTNNIAPNGGISLLSIAVADDGAIYAANEVNTSGTGAAGLFRLYRWSNSSPDTIADKIFTAQILPGDTTRWGDTMAVRGSGTNTEILVDSNAGTLAAILKPTDATLLTWTATQLGNNYGSGSIGRSLQFGETNSFWQKRKGDRLLWSTYDLSSGVTSELTNYVWLSTNLGPVALDLSRQLLAGIEFAIIQQPGNAVALPDMLVVYNVADSANPALIGRFPMPAGQATARANANFIGQVVFAADRLYVVEGNNGVLGFQIPSPTLRLTRSGSNSALSWTNADSGYGLQAAPAVSGTWTNLSQPINNANGHFSATETTLSPAKFYRLKK